MSAPDPSAARSQCQLPASTDRMEYDSCDGSGVHAMPRHVWLVAALTYVHGNAGISILNLAWLPDDMIASCFARPPPATRLLPCRILLGGTMMMPASRG
jgi:hypothetical protein